MQRANINSHLERLDVLASLLKSDDFLTVRELAKALEVSPRTLYRDINILRDRGLPIDADKGKGGGVRLHRSWGVGKINLTNNEIVDLLISIAVSEKMNSPLFMRDLRSIRYKLLALLAPEQKIKLESLRNRVLIGSSASPTVHSSYEQSEVSDCMELNAAFVFQKQLSMSYCDEKGNVTNRTIEPHYLYFNYPVWYVFAWDHRRLDYRTFRVDRILESQMLEQQFQVRAFDEFSHLIDTDNPIVL